MGGLRADGLPHPVDGTQEYLAAILDELRGLRADLSPREVLLEAPASEQPEELMHVTEPQAADAPEAEQAPAAEPAASAEQGGEEGTAPAAPPAPEKPKAPRQQKPKSAAKPGARKAK